MYVAVRRYEGVTDPEEAARITREIFVPIIREKCLDSWVTMTSMSETA
jgi:hypothetical protein